MQKLILELGDRFRYVFVIVQSCTQKKPGPQSRVFSFPEFGMRKSILTVLTALLLSAAAHAQTATLEFSWTLPAKLDDTAGTPLAASDISQCAIYEATVAGVPVDATKPAAVIKKPATGNVTGAYAMLAVTGTKRYVMTCTAFGLESDWSNVVLVTLTRPTKTTTFQVRVVFTTAGQ